MKFDFLFFFNSALLGAGLAMDAMSVSFANGLNEPCMKRPRMLGIAGVFAFFQALMPMLGWICVHTVMSYFKSLEKFIPWISLILLGFIGGKMLLDGIKNQDQECGSGAVGIGGLILQGIATSIDALSVGFTTAEYNWVMALVSSLVIGIITYFICYFGLYIGRKFGTKFAGKASMFGGIVLILIGIEIFVTSFI